MYYEINELLLNCDVVEHLNWHSCWDKTGNMQTVAQGHELYERSVILSNLQSQM